MPAPAAIAIDVAAWSAALLAARPPVTKGTCRAYLALQKTGRRVIRREGTASKVGATVAFGGAAGWPQRAALNAPALHRLGRVRQSERRFSEGRAHGAGIESAAVVVGLAIGGAQTTGRRALAVHEVFVGAQAAQALLAAIVSRATGCTQPWQPVGPTGQRRRSGPG